MTNWQLPCKKKEATKHLAHVVEERQQYRSKLRQQLPSEKGHTNLPMRFPLQPWPNLHTCQTRASILVTFSSMKCLPRGQPIDCMLTVGLSPHAKLLNTLHPFCNLESLPTLLQSQKLIGPCEHTPEFTPGSQLRGAVWHTLLALAGP